MKWLLILTFTCLTGCQNTREIELSEFTKLYQADRHWTDYWHYDGMHGKYHYLDHYQLIPYGSTNRWVDAVRIEDDETVRDIVAELQRPIYVNGPTGRRNVKHLDPRKYFLPEWLRPYE